jgi:hypothetical protein
MSHATSVYVSCVMHEYIIKRAHCRFHNAAEEISIGHDVVPPVSDEVQLTVDEYRSRLYEVAYLS